MKRDRPLRLPGGAAATVAEVFGQQMRQHVTEPPFRSKMGTL